MKTHNLIFILLTCITFFTCENINNPSSGSLYFITETGEGGSNDFIGKINLNDWDSSSYEHLTIRKNYWINKAIADTILVTYYRTDKIRIHNLSQAKLYIQLSAKTPFVCSKNSLALDANQTADIQVSVDTPLVAQNPEMISSIILDFGNNEKIQYVAHWIWSLPGRDPLSIPKNDCLYPAFPNPSEKGISLQFAVESKKNVLLYVLDNEGQVVDTLINEDLMAGVHLFYWLGSKDERDKITTGIYKFVMKTNSYT